MGNYGQICIKPKWRLTRLVSLLHPLSVGPVYYLGVQCTYLKRDKDLVCFLTSLLFVIFPQSQSFPVWTIAIVISLLVIVLLLVIAFVVMRRRLKKSVITKHEYFCYLASISCRSSVGLRIVKRVTSHLLFP